MSTITTTADFIPSTPIEAPARKRRGGRLARILALALVGIGLVAVAPRPAEATTAQSWGFACDSSGGWVRANWPTITTNSSRPSAVYFRAFLYRWTGSKWSYYGGTRWYVGVSDRYRRYQLDSSLGALPYPFVGTLGHLFAYTSGGRSYAAPQLGPWWGNLPPGSYSTSEQYYVNGTKYTQNDTHVQGTSYTYCQI